MELIVALAVLLVASVAALFAYFHWMKKKNKEKSIWGINLEALKPGTKIKCPECGSELPKFRRPENMRQLLWGGFTSKNCGREYDKWLRQIHS